MIFPGTLSGIKKFKLTWIECAASLVYFGFREHKEGYNTVEKTIPSRFIK